MKISKKLILAYTLLIIFFLFSLLNGRYSLSVQNIINIIFNNEQSMSSNIFYNIRLVRCVEVVLCGMALAIAGFLYQSSLHNDLASPDILGVSGGASIGAIISILYFDDSIILRQIFSFTGGIIAVIISLLISKLITQNKKVSLLLSGVICSAITNSIIMAFKYLADPTTQLAVIDYWLMGSFSLINKSKLLGTLIIVLPCLLLVILFRYRLKALLLDEEEAKTLGVNTKALYYFCVILSTLLTASCVSVSGIISWIGLLAPHITKIIFRTSFEETLLLCMPIGGIILLLSDTLARTLTMSEIPISIFTSLIGAIFLFIFLINKNKKYD